MRFRLSKYVFEGLELKLFSYIIQPCCRSQNIKYNFLQSHCGQDLAESTFMYCPTGRNISYMFAMLQRFFSELSLHLNSSDTNRVPFYTTQKNSQPQFIFWTWFLFNLSLFNRALVLSYYRPPSPEASIENWWMFYLKIECIWNILRAGEVGGISAILVKNHFFILLNKFNLHTIIYNSLKFQTSITVVQSFIRPYSM